MATAHERYRARLGTMRGQRGRARPADGPVSSVEASGRKGPDAAARAIATQLGVTDPTVTEQMAAALRSGQPDRATTLAMQALLGTDGAMGLADATSELAAAEETDSSDDEEAPPPPVADDMTATSSGEDGTGAAAYVPRCSQIGGQRTQRRRKSGKARKAGKARRGRS